MSRAEQYLTRLYGLLGQTEPAAMIREYITEQCALERQRCIECVTRAKLDLGKMDPMQIQTMPTGVWLERLRDSIREQIRSGR